MRIKWVKRILMAAFTAALLAVCSNESLMTGNENTVKENDSYERYETRFTR